MTLSVVWFFMLAVLWSVYLFVDSFFGGAAMVHRFIVKEEQKQYIVMKHATPNGYLSLIWLALAIAGTFLGFPALVDAVELPMRYFLYLVIACVVLRIITTNLAMSSKLGEKQKAIAGRVLTVVTALIPYLVGMFVANLFLGLELNQTGFVGSSLSLFSIQAISSGFLYGLLFMSNGAMWIRCRIEDADEDSVANANRFMFSGYVMVTMFCILMMLAFLSGWVTMMNSQLFQASFLTYLVPIIAVAAGIAGAVMTDRKKIDRHRSHIVICYLIMEVGYLFTGFLMIYPNILPSTIDFEPYSETAYSLTIAQSAADSSLLLPLVICFTVAAVLLAVVQILVYRKTKDFNLPAEHREVIRPF